MTAAPGLQVRLCLADEADDRAPRKEPYTVQPPAEVCPLRGWLLRLSAGSGRVLRPGPARVSQGTAE